MAQEPRTAQERARELLRAALATPSWLPTTEEGRPEEAKLLVWVIRCAIVLGLLVLIASAVDKGLWAWLDLLIVPVVLAVGGYLFNLSQTRRTEKIAAQRRQEDTLQAYLDHIGSLLLDEEKRVKLETLEPENDEPNKVRTLARARTLTALDRVGSQRKGTIVRFLREAHLILIQNRNQQAAPIIELSFANLKGASLQDAFLKDTSLSGADLSGADLSGADLSGADLRGARGLTQEQIDLTIGSNRTTNSIKKTELPKGLNRPQWWSRSIEEQRRIVQELLLRRG